MGKSMLSTIVLPVAFTVEFTTTNKIGILKAPQNTLRMFQNTLKLPAKCEQNWLQNTFEQSDQV